MTVTPVVLVFPETAIERIKGGNIEIGGVRRCGHDTLSSIGMSLRCVEEGRDGNFEFTIIVGVIGVLTGLLEVSVCRYPRSVSHSNKIRARSSDGGLRAIVDLYDEPINGAY